MHNKTFLSLFAAGALSLGLAACGDDTGAGSGSGSGDTTAAGSNLSGQLAGAGSSAQEAAQQAWRAGFQEANPDVTVSYDPVGSGGGREQFTAGGVAFAGSDAALADQELTAGQKRCGGADKLIEVPVYVSPIAIAYNLDGVDQLNLAPATVAKIFKGEITTWDDPAIKQDNPDASLPGERITVVHRSDESGTTENFIDYLSQAAPDVWTDEVSGDWPIKGQEAAEGTSGVVAAIKQGSGTIGYADASQARDLGVAAVGVGSEFVGPSAEAAAKILSDSQQTQDPGEYVFTYELNRKTEQSGTYPVVLTSYALACTSYDDAQTGALVKGYLGYVLSDEGQQAAAQAAGSAPLSQAELDQYRPAVEAIAAS